MRELLIQRAEQNPYFDAAIIGGTWCGLSLALEFARAGKRVLLIEKEDFESKEESPYLFIPPDDPLLRFAYYCHDKLSFPLSSVETHFPIESWKGGVNLFFHSTHKKLLSHLKGFAKPSTRQWSRNLMKDEGILLDYSALTWSFLKHAIEEGAILLNHTEAKKILHQQGKIKGLELQDRFMGRTFRIFTPLLINLSPSFEDPLIKNRILLSKQKETKGWIVPSEKSEKPKALLTDQRISWSTQYCSFHKTAAPLNDEKLRVTAAYYTQPKSLSYLFEEKAPSIFDFFLFDLSALPQAIDFIRKRFALISNPFPKKSLRIPDSLEDDPCLFAIRYQMARSVEDVLMRRVPLCYTHPKKAIEKAAIVALLFKQEFGKLLDWQEKAIASFRTMMKNRMS